MTSFVFRAHGTYRCRLRLPNGGKIAICWLAMPDAEIAIGPYSNHYATTVFCHVSISKLRATHQSERPLNQFGRPNPSALAELLTYDRVDCDDADGFADGEKR